MHFIPFTVFPWSPAVPQIHRFYKDLMYGRDGGEEESTGIALARVQYSVAGVPCYLVVTYEYVCIKLGNIDIDSHV